VCSLCIDQGVDNVKPCFRKYHFAQHFRNIHPGVNIDTYEETSVVCSETEFPRKCGFCKHRFASRQERIDHIADHFKQGKCMLDWNDSDDSQDSDNTDDDDDKPSDDGSDGSRPAHQPPDRDPRGDADPKYYGGGSDSTGGSGGSGGSQGGFFQFQLSQLNDGKSGTQSSHINPTNQSSQIQQRTRCASEPLFERSVDQPSSAGQWYTRSNLDAPKRDNAHALARDAVSGALVQQELDARAVKDQDRVPDDQHSAAFDTTAKKMDAHALLASQQHKTGAESMTDPPAIDGCSNRPKDPIEARSDEIEFTPIDDIVTSQAMAPLGQGRTSSPGLPPPESKMVSDQLTRGQALQTIATTSQSFLSVRFLGSGGFSTVDEVVHRSTKLRLGRKTLKNRDPAAIKELWKEVNVLQKLRHPHVIRFLGAYSKGDKMSMLLSPIADTTLALWLDRHKQDRPANFGQMITKMFGCLASSVRYLHEQRPVVKHMDIKPQNILIVEGDGEFPHVVLCDFGISSSDDLMDGRIQPLTRQYVAPEAFEGFTRKQAADIWSLGCVWTEMASVHYGQANSSWTDLREEFSGRATKYYWQDVPSLQNRLTALLDEAATMIECTVVRTLKSMLSARPDERPDAAALTMLFTPASCCLSWPNDKAAYPGPQEELSSVEMIIHEDGVDCRAQLHQHGHDPAGPPGMSSAKSWIEQCSHTHDACSHVVPTNAKSLPTRLVDICPDGQAGSSIRIVDSALIESLAGPVDYITLSHVWSQSDATLTTERLQTPHAHADIPLSMLSPALNAAITAARGLEYRYVWSDLLCVLQDSDDDKRKECASMASTFRNAALTLVLDNIENGTTDFKESFARANGTGVANASSGFALDTRAWALQERLLSHRFLHLGQEQMYWECNSLKASETFPQGLPSLVWEKAHTKTDDTLLLSKSDNSPVARTALQSHGSKPDQLAANVEHSHYPRRARTPKQVHRHYECTSTKPAQTMKPHALRRHEPQPHTNEAPLSSSPTCCEVPHIRNGMVFVTAQGTVKSKIQDGLASASMSSSSSSSYASSSSSKGRQEISVCGQTDQNGNGNGSTKSAIASVNAKAASIGGDADKDGNEDGRNGSDYGDGDGPRSERLHNGGYRGMEKTME
jgi:serine/threonine protein kinase